MNVFSADCSGTNDTVFNVGGLLNNQLLKMSSLFCTLVFLPVVTHAAIIGIVWMFLLRPLNGPTSGLLLSVGSIDSPIDFLCQTAIVDRGVCLEVVGCNNDLVDDALQVVTSDVEEGGDLDGCKLILHIILPIIRPFALVILVISAVDH